jgi:Membrane bound FAD containing D-sorbitol dehydrogenase
MSGLSRRAFLLIAPLLAPVARLRAGARQTPTPAGLAPVSEQEFLRLSQRLVGRTTLDAQVAATYRNALLAVPANIPLLADLTRGAAPDSRPTPERLDLERTIIEWWYTGRYTVGGEPRLATHTGALMWDAIGTPAPGSCVGASNAWSRPPAPVA